MQLSVESLLLLCALAASGALFICGLRLPIARTMNLVDEPDAERKRHAHATPLVGGLAVFPAIALACVAAVSEGAGDDAVAILYGVVFGFFMIGYADDRIDMRPTRRLLMSLALFGSLILMAKGFSAPSFRFGSVDFPIGDGAVAFLGIVGATGALNAINMADGKDGLCSGVMLIWLGFLTIALPPAYADAALITAAAMGVAFLFNLGGLVFLGDLGAYGVGSFILALMLAGAGAGAIDHGQIVSLLAVPVVDCVLLMIERRRQGRSPYVPDRRHLHHLLEARFGKLPSLALYLAVVTIGAAGGLVGGWGCVAAILIQTAFVAWIRVSAGPAEAAPSPAQPQATP